MNVTCRYCPLYCPHVSSPIMGYCLAPVIPQFVTLPVDACPLGGSIERIRGLARLRLLEGHDVRRISFYGVSSSGTRSPMFPTLDKLDSHIRGRGEEYHRYVVFIDSDGIPFYRICLDSSPETTVV